MGVSWPVAYPRPRWKQGRTWRSLERMASKESFDVTTGSIFRRSITRSTRRSRNSPPATISKAVKFTVEFDRKAATIDIHGPTASRSTRYGTFSRES